MPTASTSRTGHGNYVFVQSQPTSHLSSNVTKSSIGKGLLDW